VDVLLFPPTLLAGLPIRAFCEVPIRFTAKFDFLGSAFWDRFVWFDGGILWHSGDRRQWGTGGVLAGVGAKCADQGD